ncbi:MAG: hypothetical protein E3J76_01230, partial [Candidatus Aminicenantes bacterium]
MAEQAKLKTKGEIPEIFKDSFFISEKATARKAFAFPFAFFLHAAIIIAMLVIPLLSTSNLPTVEVYSAFLAPPPPPPPPP